MTKFAIATFMAWIIGFAVFLILVRCRVAGSLATTIAYFAAICATAIFHGRYVRTQREFLVRKHPWVDFIVSSLAEWMACAAAAIYIDLRVQKPSDWEMFLLPFVIALLVRYVLRKEFLLDVRGLRREIRKEEIV
jgi:hypothetical protein